LFVSIDSRGGVSFDSTLALVNDCTVVLFVSIDSRGGVSFDSTLALVNGCTVV